MRNRVTGVTRAGSPTVRRRELGALLRVLRTDAGMTVDQVADSLMCSPSKVSRMETGHRGVSPRDIRDLCELYGVNDQGERERLAGLAQEGKVPGWWQPFDLDPLYATFVGLESEALSISEYGAGVFPGLLQTPDYARALHEAIVPRLSPDEIAQRVEVRVIRQRVLARPDPPQFMAIMDEAVLRRVVGSPAVMRDQLKRVIEAASLPNVTIRVLPYGAGAHAALDSTFIILEFPAPVPGVIYVTGLVGQIYLEREQDVQRYWQVFDQLRALALEPEDSIDLLSKVLRTYRDG
jgi:transcriptional regulator with XRE-family HTH domain